MAPVLMKVRIVFRLGHAPAAGGDHKARGLAQFLEQGGLLGSEGLFPKVGDVVAAGHAQNLFQLHIAVYKGAVQQLGQGRPTVLLPEPGMPMRIRFSFRRLRAW